MEDSVLLSNRFAVKLVRIINIVLITLNTAVALAMFWMVVSRHFLPGSPMLWIEEMIILLALWLYFIGGASCSFGDEHVKGGFLDIWLSEEALKTVRIIAGFCELSIVLIYTWLATKYFIYLFNSNKSAIYLDWNKSWWELSVVVGLGLMAVFVVSHLAVNIKRKKSPEEVIHDDYLA